MLLKGDLGTLVLVYYTNKPELVESNKSEFCLVFFVLWAYSKLLVKPCLVGRKILRLLSPTEVGRLNILQHVKAAWSIHPHPKRKRKKEKKNEQKLNLVRQCRRLLKLFPMSFFLFPVSLFETDVPWLYLCM